MSAIAKLNNPPVGKMKNSVCAKTQTEFFGPPGGILRRCRAFASLRSLPTSAKTVHRTVFFRTLTRSPSHFERNEKLRLRKNANGVFFGPPGGIRTPGLWNRNPLRYPASPRAAVRCYCTPFTVVLQALFCAFQKDLFFALIGRMRFGSSTREILNSNRPMALKVIGRCLFLLQELAELSVNIW